MPAISNDRRTPQIGVVATYLRELRRHSRAARTVHQVVTPRGTSPATPRGRRPKTPAVRA